MSHISQLRAGISPTFTNKHYQFNHANDSILFTETFDISKFRVRVGPESDLEEHHLEFESERDQPIAQVTVMSKIELVNMKDQDGNTRLDENGKPQIEVQHSSLDFSISVFDEKLAPYLFNPDQDKQPLIDIANSRMQTEAAKLNSR